MRFTELFESLCPECGHDPCECDDGFVFTESQQTTYYALVQRANNRVLSTHTDIESAKDELRGLAPDQQAMYKIIKTTKQPLQHNMSEGLRDPADNPCWKGYKPVGTKKKNGRTVPNCVPKESQQ